MDEEKKSKPLILGNNRGFGYMDSHSYGYGYGYGYG